MDIKEFIEKAIDGGWKPDFGRNIEYAGHNSDWSVWNFTDGNNKGSSTTENNKLALLDPKAWEAVGKVEGWEDETYDINMPANNKRGAYKIKMKRRKSKSEPAWKKKQLNFVKHLQQGLSIEEALAQINN